MAIARGDSGRARERRRALRLRPCRCEEAGGVHAPSAANRRAPFDLAKGGAALASSAKVAMAPRTADAATSHARRAAFAVATVGLPGRCAIAFALFIW
ncbi:MAG: hypothetical protein IPF73_07805 [Betaproteobacteria bacterium]|nr:hypothetical protein [Betaproteobacteria bacterium]